MSHKFFQNRKCKYFPCHAHVKEKDFNCLFCYCPLYFNCTERNYEGKKCEFCYYPHVRNNYHKIIRKLKDDF